MSKTTITINKKDSSGCKVISVRIKEKTLKKIDEISKATNHSRNELINIILENSIDDVIINWKIHFEVNYNGITI